MSSTGTKRGEASDGRRAFDLTMKVRLCEEFEKGPKMKATDFVRMKFPSDAASMKPNFLRWHAQYKAGKLRAANCHVPDAKRQRRSKYEPIETQLVEYSSI